MFLISGLAWKREIYNQKMANFLSNGKNKM
jgi:hypothetical protein